MRSAGPGDDQARFLADLRALRDMAAIEYDELAARAHYPSDVLKEAENGPLLPGLPILTAYVRACDGDVPDWEERWRRLTSEIPEDPDLPVRPAGASPAAVAGARAGVGIAPPEVYDPERIKAALRGGHARSGQGASGTGGRNGSRDADARSTVASGWSTAPSWDASSDESIATANGNRTETSWSREPFDPAVKPNPAESVEQFRWLPDEESAFSAGDTGPADTGPAHTGPGGTGPAGLGPADPPTAAPPDAEPSVSEWTPRWDEAAKPAEGTDFWSTSEAGLQQPAASPQVDEQSYPDTSWSAPAWTPAPSPPRPAQSAPGAARSPLASEPAPNAGVGAATATQPRTSAGSVGTPASAGSAASVASAGFPAAQTSTHEAAPHQKDRSFPTQLLVIIIIAALIGSALVLLIK
jgi:hypothetical protein